MPEATVTSKGQLTVPVEVRRELGLVAGSKVDFIREGDGSYRVVPVRGSVRALKGAAERVGPAASLADMDDAIAAESARGFSA